MVFGCVCKPPKLWVLNFVFCAAFFNHFSQYNIHPCPLKQDQIKWTGVKYDGSVKIANCISPKLKIVFVQIFAGILFPAGGARGRSSHYGQSEIRANYGANQHHLQAARPKPFAGKYALKICTKNMH